jgi:hypothetical protein
MEQDDIPDLGVENQTSGVEVKQEKKNVEPWDIFKLANGILIVATLIYVLLA